MAEITEKQIKHLAELSALNLNDEEILKMKGDLQNILNFAGKVQSLNVENQTSNEVITSLSELREDTVVAGLSNEQATMNAPKKENGCYVVSKVVE